MGAATQHVQVSDKKLTPMGDEQITGLSTVKSLTVPAGADRALIQPESQNIRWRDNGEDPTASVGIQVAAGNEFWYTGNLSAIKFIEESASAKINVAYYKAA